MGGVRPDDDEDGRPWWIPWWFRLPERPRSTEGWAGWTVAALVMVWLLHQAWRWSVDHSLWALLVLAAVAFVADRYWRSLWRIELQRRDRIASYSLTWDEITGMHWQEFEFAVVHLMRRDGIDAAHTGKTSDFSVDVAGDDPVLGERWAVQVKHYSPTNRVGSRDAQQLAGAAEPFYRARLMLIVTTSGYTRNAQIVADKTGIHLIGRRELIRWACEGIHLYGVLGITPDTSYENAG